VLRKWKARLMGWNSNTFSKEKVVRPVALLIALLVAGTFFVYATLANDDTGSQ
jgi:hypothetical protein